MEPSCSIVTTERQLTAVVKAQVPFVRVPEAQRLAREKVDAVLRSLDVGPLGRACTRFRTPGDGTLAMEMGAIVARRFEPRDEVVLSELPAGRAAHFLLKGSFQGLPGAWQTLFDWCRAEKLDLAGINWEIYSPWQDVEPAKLETHLYAKLA
jgi:hypothetical protein